MAHGTRINALDSFYVDGAPIPATYFQSVDGAQNAAIDGDTGGSWAPSSPIVVAGSGIWCAGPWSYSGAVGTIAVSSSAPVTFGDSDYFNLNASHADATRTLLTNCDTGIDASGSNGFLAQDSATSGMYDPRLSGATGSGLWRLLVPLRVHHGATLSQVTFNFSIATGHGALPQYRPTTRVYQVDLLGNVVNLFSGTWLVIGSAVNTVGAYEALTSATFPVVGGTIIDTSQYRYHAEIVDETGLSSQVGNKWHSIACTFASIADLRPQ